MYTLLLLSLAVAAEPAAGDPTKAAAVVDVLAAMARPPPDAARLDAYAADCAKGDIAACADAGVVYERANRRDDAVAAHLAACAGGWWFSCNNLILLGEPRGRTLLADRHRAACATGSAYACDQLSLYTVDPAERDAAMDRGCELGAAMACYGVGLRLSAVDPARALEAYRRACTLGSPDGCEDLALLEGARATPARPRRGR